MSDLEKEYGVLLYCHGKEFPIEQEIAELLELSYLIINKKDKMIIDSINTSESTKPTIYSEDGNLPEELSSKFNVIVDYNCDNTGYAVTQPNFEKYTKPLYTNMIKALNPEAWCFITSFSNVDPDSTPEYRDFFNRIKKAEERRINLLQELIIKHCKYFSNVFVEKTPPDKFNVTYIIFFGGYIL